MIEEKTLLIRTMSETGDSPVKRKSKGENNKEEEEEMSTKNLNSMMDDGNDGDDKGNHMTTSTCTDASANSNSNSILGDGNKAILICRTRRRRWQAPQGEKKQRKCMYE